MIDVLMATLGEYDTLWDGVLFPEIIDAEYHDCDVALLRGMPRQLHLMAVPIIQQPRDRVEALTTLLATVNELSQRCPKELCSEGVDAVLTDCSTPNELQLLYPNIIVIPEP